MITTDAAIIRHINRHMANQNITTVHTTVGSMTPDLHQFVTNADGTLRFQTTNGRNYFGMTLVLNVTDNDGNNHDIEAVCVSYDPDTNMEFRDRETGKQSIIAQPDPLHIHCFTLSNSDGFRFQPPNGVQTGWFVTEDTNTHTPLRYYAHILNLYSIIENLHP